jgi:hypothetical protein
MQPSLHLLGSGFSGLTRKLIICSILVLLAGIAYAVDEIWTKKDYTQWSLKECTEMLEKSPWSRVLRLTNVVIKSSEENNAMASQGDISARKVQPSAEPSHGASQQPYILYTAQFRSAQPIRKALVRQMQLDQKYDKLAPQQKQEFDKKAQQFLSTDLSQMIVVGVTYSTNHAPYDLDLVHHWQSQTADSLKNSVHLIRDKGDKIPLIGYAPMQRGFQLIFPRKIEGQEVLTAQDKFIKLEFPYPAVGGMGDERAFFEFDVNKMVIQDKIVY